MPRRWNFFTVTIVIWLCDWVSEDRCFAQNALCVVRINPLCPVYFKLLLSYVKCQLKTLPHISILLDIFLKEHECFYPIFLLNECKD